jgi:hypothetical protein
MANYRVSTNKTTAIRQHMTKQTKSNNKTKKMDQLRLFKLKHHLLKISAFAAGTHLAEGQCLKEQLKVVKLCMF